jgi:glucose/arabinose dehydrogenase
VGAGNLVRISKKSPLIDWRGDLLVVHMGAQNLHRLKLSGDKVVLDEKISVNERIRDIIIDEKGFILLSLDSGNLIKISTFDSIRK